MHQQTYVWLAIAAMFVVGLLGPVTETSAQQARRNRRAGATQAPSAPSTAAMDSARQALSDARVAATKIDLQLNNVKRTLQEKHATQPEVVAAQAEVLAAQAAYDAAKDKVRDALKASSAEYRAAATVLEDARARKTALQNQPGVDPTLLANAAADFMAAESATSKLEIPAFEADPPTREAKAEYDKAVAKLAALWAKFEESFKSDPTKVNADQAHAKVVQAEKTYQTDAKNYADAQAAYQKAVQQAQAAARQQAIRNGGRRNNGNGGTGGNQRGGMGG